MYIIWTIVFAILFQQNPTNCDETTTIPSVPGFILENNSSSICSENPSIDTSNFVLCTFLLLNDDDSNELNNSTIFELWDSTNSFELLYTHNVGHFQLIFNNKVHVYPKKIAYNEWIKLCLSITNGTKVKMEVNYRTTRNATYEEEMEEESKIEKGIKRENTESPISAINSNVYLCAGKYGKLSSFVGSIAGIILLTEENRTQSRPQDSCIFDITQDTISAFPNFTNTSGSVREELYTLEDICWDTHVFLLLEDTSKYDEHLARCNSLSGRLVQQEEMEIFKEKLNEIYLNKTNSTEIQEVLSGSTFLFGGTVGAFTLTVFCPIYDLIEYKSRQLPCLVELDYNFCMVPKYTDFFYYGALEKYDIYYTLQTKNNTMLLMGDEGTVVEKRDDHWILHSILHKEYVTLHNTTLPVGRNKWKFFDEVTEYNLTFTYCETDQFSCSNGDCLPLEARCNGTVECLDETDEESCELINKKSGYVISRTPPPRKNESHFVVKYFAHVFNIADISSSDGVAVVDAFITMTWHDPRIKFNDPVPDEEVDCKEIWSPLMSMADGAYSGFQITFESYRSSCIVLSSKYDTNITKHRVVGDPFMSQYADGNDLPISYLFAGLITVPCRFDLRKYPFGTQSCNISFWPDNAFLTSNYKMENYNPLDFKGSKDSNVLSYLGRKDLGEFYFQSATHHIERDDRMVVLTFKLQNLYGFHMLNSFTPSILISLIAYFTFFFPVTDFNERVMVSLTALLVLAAFFTQASGTSVKTPYFKYIDVWYVVLIAYCFFIVIANMIIHKFRNLDNKRKKMIELMANAKGIELDTMSVAIKDTFLIWISKKVDEVNLFFEVVFAAYLVVFIVLYSLGASNVI